jgi:guanosine-3',5'-bis(diphosphate) 3'-pyrophosphohydrolase
MTEQHIAEIDKITTDKKPDMCLIDRWPGDELFAKISAYNQDFDREYVRKAVDFAVKYHGSQQRASGEPYYYHPIAVACILADLRMDLGTIVTALLHDTVEDTEATLDDIRREFGANIAYIVDGVTKLDKLQFQSENEKQAENFRKLLMAISEDIRVLLVKLADRLHNMRTLHHIPKPEKRARIARETLDIYAPLAERVGVHLIKVELQDIAFRELNPEVYSSILSRLKFLSDAEPDLIQNTVASIQTRLEASNIKAEVSGRQKMPFSIYLKMQKKKLGFESVTDIIAFRIVTESLDDCYRALGVIHSNFRMIPGFFEDYISNPKSNDYQSIHTIVMGENNQRIEIQIRTRQMHEIAEYGVAAHWAYKQSFAYNVEGAQYTWVQKLLSVLELADNPDEVLENTKLEMYHDQVFCFTPAGDLIVLPKGASPVDFAFAVHSQVGRTCVGAKVNGRLVPLRIKLKNGDQVEILQAKVISIIPAWISFVKTGRAKAEINRFIRSKRQNEYAVLGQNIVSQIFLKHGEQPNEARLEGMLAKFAKKDYQSLYAALGEGNIKRIEVVKHLYPDAKIVKVKKAKSKENLLKDSPEEIKISLSGLTEGLGVSYANCCNPLPGEKIVGIQDASGGITVHTTDCEELERYVEHPERWLEVKWDENTDGVFVSRLDLQIQNRKGALAEIANIIAQNEGNIYNLRFTQKGQDFTRMLVDVEVKSLRHFVNIEKAVRASKLVHSVKRFKKGAFELDNNRSFNKPK